MSPWIVAALFSTILVVFLSIRQETQAKGRWGLNLQRTCCPTCDATLPFIRKPTSRRQKLWGGWTCEACGTEIDKWGRRIDRTA